MALLLILAAVALVQAAAQEAPQDPAQADTQEESADSAQTAAREARTATARGNVSQAPADPAQVAAQEGAIDPALDAAPQAPEYTAQAVAQQASMDRRIQLLPYHADQIVTLGVSPGFASVVELSQDERVENVVVGNSASWQVTANRRGDRIIVKPLAGAAPSNMIVLTGSRRYVFVLDPFSETSFVMRFTYPQPVQTVAATAPVLGYKFRGDKALFPLAMSDDGRRTVITWGEQNALPAIFAMNDGRHERLVNGRMVGNDYVIEGAAIRYKFRYGKAEATAIRQMPKRRR